MVNQIQTKNCGRITHVKVPTELLDRGTKRKPPTDQTAQALGTKGTNPQPPKNQKIQQPHNTDLVAFFNKKRMVDAGNPPLGQICAYCGITKEQLLPELPRIDCRQFLVMGSCMFGSKCKNSITALRQLRKQKLLWRSSKDLTKIPLDWHKVRSNQ